MRELFNLSFELLNLLLTMLGTSGLMLEIALFLLVILRGDIDLPLRLLILS